MSIRFKKMSSDCISKKINCESGVIQLLRFKVKPASLIMIAAKTDSIGKLHSSTSELSSINKNYE